MCEPVTPRAVEEPDGSSTRIRRPSPSRRLRRVLPRVGAALAEGLAAPLKWPTSTTRPSWSSFVRVPPDFVVPWQGFEVVVYRGP